MNVIKTLLSGLALSLFLPLAAEAEIEPATGILGFASASYSCSKAPRVDEGGPGFALFQIPSQAPYRALAYAAAQSRGIERLGMVVAVSDFCYAGSYSGQIPGLGWRSIDEQIDNLFERWPQLADPWYPGPKYVVLGPFNNGLQTAGAVPELVDGCSTPDPNDTCDPSVLLFTDDTGTWSNEDGRDIHFARIDAAIQRLRDAGVYPVIMGYPDPALLDLDYWLAVFGTSLPPWTEVTTTAGIETLAEYDRQRYEGRLGEGILYVPTDEIPAEDIGDGLHLEYVYHKLSARALARTIAAHQAFLDAFGF